MSLLAQFAGRRNIMKDILKVLRCIGMY